MQKAFVCLLVGLASGMKMNAKNKVQDPGYNSSCNMTYNSTSGDYTNASNCSNSSNYTDDSYYGNSNFGYYNDIGDYCDHNGCHGAYGSY